jgi:micrococcal nuclease
MNKLRGRRALLLVVALCAAAPAQAFSGVVTHVVDGDTLWLRPDPGQGGVSNSKPRAFRLRGIDAPEICQPWGPQAKAALESRVLHRQVTLRGHASDGYARRLVTLELNGEDIGAWMVGQGHAWNSTFRQHPGPYAALERTARSSRRGLFAQVDPQEPRRFRKAHGPCARR